MPNGMSYHNGGLNMLDLIRLGDNSRAVVKLQTCLLQKIPGLTLKPDGDFGPATETAVKTYQTSMKMVADGIVGQRTITALGLDMRPTLASEADFAACAQALGVTPAHVKAVAEVETRAAAFLADGRTPILYERHVFWKQCIIPRKPGETKDSLIQMRKNNWAIVAPDVCNPSQGGYGAAGAAQYDRLNKAIRLNEPAALESASWGTFQIMGYHATNIGWRSVQAFVRAMQASQGDHLRAFTGWIKDNPRAHNALKAKDWATFALCYNGEGYKANKYDTKMAAAYKKYGGL